jgi:hypothetical protein
VSERCRRISLSDFIHFGNNIGVNKQGQSLMTEIINNSQLVAVFQLYFIVNFHQWLKITEHVPENNLITSNTFKKSGEFINKFPLLRSALFYTIDKPLAFKCYMACLTNFLRNSVLQ